MKKILLILSGLILFPPIAQADCPDKIAHCKGGGVTLLNQQWDWKRAKCAPCVGKCRYGLEGAMQFCLDKGGIGEIKDLKHKEKYEQEDEQLRQQQEIFKETYSRVLQYCEERMYGLSDRDTLVDCNRYAFEEASEASGLKEGQAPRP